MVTRPRRILLVAVAVVVGASSCSDDDESTAPGRQDGRDRAEVREEQLGPFDVDREHFGPPGSPLGASLTVPPGALVAGEPFPAVEGSGFRAQLLVVGDPLAVYNDVQDQASASGMTPTGGCMSAGGNFACRTRFVDPSDGEVLTLDLRRQALFAGVISGMTIAYGAPGTIDPRDAPPPSGVPPTGPVAPVALPDGSIGLPDPQDFALALRPPTGRVPVVESGSELVAPVAPCACGEGWTAVMAVTAPVRDVMAAYTRQFADLGSPPDIESSLRDNITYLSVRVGQGTRFLDIRARQPDDGPVHLLLTVRES